MFLRSPSAASRALALHRDLDMPASQRQPAWDVTSGTKERLTFLEPVLVGSLLEILLFGVLIVQIYDYHRHFPRDRTVLKLAAWASFLGSAVLTIAISVDLWARVTDLRLIPVLADMTPSTKAAHAMIAVLGFTSQMFFAWRIFQLCRKWWLLVLMCSLAIPAFACLMLADIQPGIADTSSQSLGTIVTPASRDVDMDGLQHVLRSDHHHFHDHPGTHYVPLPLYNALKEAVFRKTRRTLANILKFTLETGLLTTLLIAVQMALMLQPLAAHADGGSERRWRCILYSSWLLASLNARSSFANGDTFITKLVFNNTEVDKPTAGTPSDGPEEGRPVLNTEDRNGSLEDAGIHPIGIGVKVVTKKVRQDQMK
ncbi:hypothetical protein EYR36_004093 [Pleurotus pulmonarius]|nr:hypothetical protein EYR36_004093 [Pleurotus pulmonarius]